MNIEDIKQNYYFETLTQNHDLSEFDCGDEDLNDFLKNDALTLQKSNLSLTKLVIYNEKIIGYASLLTDTLIIRNIREDNIKLDIKNQLGITSKNKLTPSVKIGRLALDKKFTGKGLGTHILRNILANLKEMSNTKVGFRFIIVEGYAKALNFYVSRNGFKSLKKDDEKINNIEFISKRDPTKRFYLYFDLNRFDEIKFNEK
jgi:predicted GNAT family N-acyltransferase